MFSFSHAIATFVLAGSAVTGITVVGNVTHDAAANNLTQLAQIQELALAGDGTYPEQLASLESSLCTEDVLTVFEEQCAEGGSGFFGNVIPMDFKIAYVLNDEGTHYVVAQLMKDDSLLVISDTVKEPIACDEFNHECIAQLTDDEQLRNSVVDWKSI